MIKAYSATIDAIRKRIKRLPELVGGALNATNRGDAVGVIKAYQEGIRENRLGLYPLKPATIRQKARDDMSQPEVPLYGLGDDEDRTLINAVRLKETKTGWKVALSKKKHWKSELTLADLFVVHEYGTVIANGFGKGITIRIPPRPAFRYALRRYMTERAERDPAQEVQEAIMRWLNRVDDSAIRRMERRGVDWRAYLETGN